MSSATNSPQPQPIPPATARHWQLLRRQLTFGQAPILMGIVNVTPDSFSDGGQYFDHQRAVDHALKLHHDGAGILDIGGESTRPYAAPVEAEEELRRVIPVIEALSQKCDAVISIDTSKAVVAEQALSAGAEIVNDVTGLEGEPEMLDVVLAHQPGVCLMHMRGTPQTMQNAPSYANVVTEVADYLKQRTRDLVQAGLDRDRICIDFGIGFGKRTQHNLELLQQAEAFHELGYPVLVGHSRKGFLGKIIGDMDADRLAATIGVAVAMATKGIQVLRIHDVAQVRQAIEAFYAAHANR